MPNAKPKTTGIITKPTLPTSPLTAPLPVNSFATLTVALPVARKQLAVPQLYPAGQQPAVAPAPEGHSDQPPAQADVVEAEGTAVSGTAMVPPPAAPEMMAVDAVEGHDAVWQSRPVWQQPPPYTAEQA